MQSPAHSPASRRHMTISWPSQHRRGARGLPVSAVFLRLLYTRLGHGEIFEEISSGSGTFQRCRIGLLFQLPRRFTRAQGRRQGRRAARFRQIATPRRIIHGRGVIIITASFPAAAALQMGRWLSCSVISAAFSASGRSGAHQYHTEADIAVIGLLSDGAPSRAAGERYIAGLRQSPLYFFLADR